VVTAAVDAQALGMRVWRCGAASPRATASILPKTGRRTLRGCNAARSGRACPSWVNHDTFGWREVTIDVRHASNSDQGSSIGQPELNPRDGSSLPFLGGVSHN
jgi:hypothetical protein